MTKYLYLMGRYEKYLIVYPKILMKTFEKFKNEKFTEKLWGHTYKSAHTSVGNSLRFLNFAYN